MAPKYDPVEAQTASRGQVEDGVKFLEQQGRTAQDIQAYVRDLRENNQEQYRTTIDAVYNRIHADAKNNSDLSELLPQIDLTDNAVDPEGAATDRADFSNTAIDAVQTDSNGFATRYGGIAENGQSGFFMDDAGHTTAFTAKDGGVEVTSTAADGTVNTFQHTDVDPSSAKLDPSTGDLTLNRTGLADGQRGSVTIHAGGAETTTIANHNNTFMTVDRTQAGGDVTGFKSTVPGMENVSCQNGVWTGLPGQTGETQPENVKVESNGQISYELPNGFDGHPGSTHVTLNEKGEPAYEQNQNGTTVKYDKDGNASAYSVHNPQGDYTLTQRDGQWIYQKQDSTTQVEVDGGTIKIDNGTVTFREAGFGVLGAQHSMNSHETTSDSIIGRSD